MLTKRDSLVAIGFILAVNGIGALPAVFIGNDTSWVERPWFYPPEILFPIVWTILFTLMGIALFIIWQQKPRPRKRRIALAAFGIQFILNVGWTPVFFGLQRPGAGLLVIAMLWIAIVTTIVAFARVSRLAASLLVPYLAWVSFAFVLNYAIYALY